MEQNAGELFQMAKNRQAARASPFDAKGRRKYLTPAERDAFLKAAAGREVRTFCHTLCFTDAPRISEALTLPADRVDLKEGTVVFESLKKRRRGLYRTRAGPAALLDALNMVHDIKAAAQARRGSCAFLWPWARNTAWRHVQGVVKAAKVKGPHAMPKGLRHGFSIKAVTSGIPLNMLQQLLGRAQLSTTSIYADAMGPEKYASLSNGCGKPLRNVTQGGIFIYAERKGG